MLAGALCSLAELLLGSAEDVSAVAAECQQVLDRAGQIHPDSPEPLQASPICSALRQNCCYSARLCFFCWLLAALELPSWLLLGTEAPVFTLKGIGEGLCILCFSYARGTLCHRLCLTAQHH